jgi:F-type H+-transporting ATPase subunit b
MLPSITTQLTASRSNSSVPQEDPKKKAQSILDSLPGSNLASKAAILSAGAGVSIAAISNEIYVVNEESIVMLALCTIFWSVAHYGGPAYKEWAEGQNAKMKGILNSARENHTSAVKERISSVKELGGVIDITKTLFEVSKVRRAIG